MTPANWIYLFFVVLVVVAMIGKRGVVLITTVGTFVIGLHYTNSLVGALQTVFRAYFNAGTSLFDLILLIALMVSMLKAMENMGADYLMVYPIKAVLKNPTVAFFCSGICDVRMCTFLLAHTGNSPGGSGLDSSGGPVRITTDGSGHGCQHLWTWNGSLR